MSSGPTLLLGRVCLGGGAALERLSRGGISRLRPLQKPPAGPSWHLYRAWLERRARRPLRHRGQEQKQQRNIRGGKETKVCHRQNFCLQERIEPQRNGRTGLPPSGRHGVGGLDDAHARTLLEKVPKSRVRRCISSYLVPGRCVWMAYDISNIDKK